MAPNVGLEKSQLEKSGPEKFWSEQYEVMQNHECFEEPEVYDVRGSHESVLSAASCSVAKAFSQSIDELKSNTAVKDLPVTCDFHSEVLLPRHKRVTSSYHSDKVMSLSANEIEVEMLRLKAEAATIERHLAVLS